MIDTSSIVRLVVQAIPDVRPHLKGRALAFIFNVDPSYKTQPFFEATVSHLITQVYNGNMGGEFIDIMANLIQGQLTDAYNQAWEDDANALPLPDYLEASLNDAILTQYDFVDQLYRDVVDARIDQTGAPTDRAELWANRWTEGYNEAKHLIAVQMGYKEMWEFGATETHCPTCEGLVGIVAYAIEWDSAGVSPQNAPNEMLSCGGWRCDCKRTQTDQRRSPDALTTIMNIVEATA